MTTSPDDLVTKIGEADPELDQQLAERLDEHNAAATAGTDPAPELTVQVHDVDGVLMGGVSGWTWGVATGIAMVWVHVDARGSGLGARMIGDFETEAVARGCRHVFVTSFTFQAPGFYERLGYRQIFSWDAVPTPEHADLHFRKELA
ncbi:MAG: GNAT family N-acetyltransferase [Actinobacteria bacterium]|uniref:Unannotated protein n=1 Tax=freshwater metagenome TaxID=449393 RepID=A0A6J6QQK8_9ZZZZ|nr:GNAT family N-acetyltransferase [Actinomycetota bacterium]